MQLHALLGLAALLSVGASAVAAAPKPTTVTKTVTKHTTKTVTSFRKTITKTSTTTSVSTTTTTTTTATATPTSLGSVCGKDSEGLYQYVCADQQLNNCIHYPNTLTGDGSIFTQFNLFYGEFRDSYYNNVAYFADPIQGGAITFPDYKDNNDYPPRCYYADSNDNAFNCFNGNGDQLTWYKNADNTVGAALQIPADSTQIQLYWISFS